MARSDFPFHLGPVQERPRALSILLIVMIVVYAFLAFGAAIAVYATFTSQVVDTTTIEQISLSRHFMKPLAVASLGISLAGALGGWGMWKWRRWGMYLFAAGALTSLAIELLLRKPVLGSPLHVTILLVLVVMLWGRWRYFD